MTPVLDSIAVKSECPWHGHAQGEADAARASKRASLQPEDALRLPTPKRLVVQYAEDPDGSRELTLYHEQVEISFDEPDMFAFGEALAHQTRFVAGDAVAWGQGYPWDRVRDLLQQLLDAGVLVRGDRGDELVDWEDAPVGDRPSPLTSSASVRPRQWQELPGLMTELVGRPLDLAHLECVVPIFRVAHMALDQDGRQVGEANVFPPALRLDVPTRWRTCIYDGTRHRSEKPMNVTALKAMRAHWPAMMALVLAVREVYVQAYPDAVGHWTIGHLERLSTAILALPSFLLMRSNGKVTESALHPALSSLFRVTDGLRMTMHQMLFVPIGEPARHPNELVSAADILAYAERNYSFHSEHGVCAGPRAMVYEFLTTVVDGKRSASDWDLRSQPQLREASDCIPDALRYGLKGLQVYAAVFSVWPEMARRYVALAEVAEQWSSRGSVAGEKLRHRLAAHVQSLGTTTFLANEAWRSHRDEVYDDMFVQCARGLGVTLTPGTLSERLLPLQVDAVVTRTVTAAWQDWAAGVAGRSIDARDQRYIEAMASQTIEHLGRMQAVLVLALERQGSINADLGRPPATKALTARDLDLHNVLQGSTRRSVPFLLDELSEILALDIAVTAESIVVTSRIGRHGAG